MKAIFLDRDGTLILDKEYLSKVEEIEYFEDSKEALEVFHQKGYKLFLVTNQSGIARGLFNEESVHLVHQQIQKDLEEWGIPPFKEIVFCPHVPEDNCSCRKPMPEMVEKLISKWKIEQSSSYMVGDKLSDPEAGLSLKVTGILVRGRTDSRFSSFETLLEFAKSL